MTRGRPNGLLRVCGQAMSLPGAFSASGSGWCGKVTRGMRHIHEVISAPLRGRSGHVKTSVWESKGASKAINRMTSLRALSLSSWKAIWQMVRCPRSPHAQTEDADPMTAKEAVRQTRWRNDLEDPKVDFPHENKVVFSAEL